MRFCSMRKDVSRARRNNSSLFQNIEITVPGDFPQRQYRLRPQNLKLTLQIAPAIQNFFGQRFVSRRRTTDCRGDVGVRKLQTVVPAQGSGLIRKPRFVQRGVEKIAGAIPCKDAPRPVTAVRRWRKAQDEKLRVRIAKSRHWLAPVGPLLEGSPLFTRHFFTIRHQSRAFSAPHNFFVQSAQQCGCFRHHTSAVPTI